MEFGVCLPNFGKHADGESIRRTAERAEQLGYTSLWSTDHVIVTPNEADPYGNTYDSMTTLAFTAAVTKRIKLGTSVLIIPMRNAIHVAKQIATIDALSKGRVILGVGIGWLRPEFQFLGADFKRRVRYTVESIKAMRSLWSDANPTFKGRFLNFENAVFLPKPAQGVNLPIWIGGNTELGIMRAARYGDAWHPVGLSPDRLQSGVTKLRDLSKDRKVAVTMRCRVQVSAEKMPEQRAPTGERRFILSGKISEIVQTLESFRLAGLEHLACYFGDEPLATTLARVTEFAREIIPSF